MIIHVFTADRTHLVPNIINGFLKYKITKSISLCLLVKMILIQICNDKWLTYNFLLDNGFFTPVSFLSVSEVLEALERNEIRFPLIIKPRWGMGSIGIFEADNIIITPES